MSIWNNLDKITYCSRFLNKGLSQMNLQIFKFGWLVITADSLILSNTFLTRLTLVLIQTDFILSQMFRVDCAILTVPTPNQNTVPNANSPRMCRTHLLLPPWSHYTTTLLVFIQGALLVLNDYNLWFISFSEEPNKHRFCYLLVKVNLNAELKMKINVSEEQTVTLIGTLHGQPPFSTFLWGTPLMVWLGCVFHQWGLYTCSWMQAGFVTCLANVRWHTW